MKKDSMKDPLKKFLQDRNYVKTLVSMTRLPLYARQQSPVSKETEQWVWYDPLGKSRVVYWSKVIGTLTKGRDGGQMIDTDRGRYEVFSAKDKAFLKLGRPG